MEAVKEKKSKNKKCT